MLKWEYKNSKIQLDKDWKKTVLIFACDEENILIAITKAPTLQNILSCKTSTVCYSVIKHWNQLPDHIIFTASYSFKRSLNNHNNILSYSLIILFVLWTVFRF